MSDLEERTERNRKVMEDFRANDGVGSVRGAALLILHTTGAKSGLPRIHPVVYLADGDHPHIFASMGGLPTHPDWYHNLVANPTVTVEVGIETYQARAVVVTGAERDRIFARQVQVVPIFGEYQERTTRIIPVVRLERIGA